MQHHVVSFSKTQTGLSSSMPLDSVHDKKTLVATFVNLGVEPKIWENPPNHPFVHRVFHYFHHPFWGTTIFGNTHFQSKLQASSVVLIGIRNIINVYFRFFD